MAKIGAGIGLALLLAGCAQVQGLWPGRQVDPAPAVAAPALPELVAPPPKPGARSAEALDTTTEAQREAATAVPAPQAEAPLGKLVVSLGDVTSPGFWLSAPLIGTAGPGLVKTAGGQVVQVELRPGSGAAQLSLAAFRALGLGLTDLPEVEVYRR